MDTPTISTGRRSRASTLLVALALAIAVSALAVQARSIWSTAATPLVRPAIVQIDGQPFKRDCRFKDDCPLKYSRTEAAHRPFIGEIGAKKSGR
jgi:hypothetical protein